MNSIRKLTGLLFSLIITGTPVIFAQISHGGTPIPLSGTVIDFKDLTGSLPDLSELASKQVPDKASPLRFAEPVKVSFSPDKTGQWHTLVDGTRVWRLGIRYKNAFSIGVIFNHFRLEKGEKVFLYDPAGHTVLGAFTPDNNKSWGSLAVAPVAGPSVVIEYQVPPGRTNHGDLSVGQVSVGFRDIFRLREKTKDRFFGTSGPCNVDINCPAGDNWQTEKNAVVRIFVNGNELCTGVLMNTAINDATPYLLTAGHCIEDSSDAANAIFVFQYESPYCDGPDGSVNKSLSGATVKATSKKVDFTLVRLSKMPPFTYQPYFAGWSNSGSAPSQTTCIHHPNGDVKKISQDQDAAVTSDYDIYDKGSFWKILQWDMGTTEPGSSGAPLFDVNHRVIGTLSGGDARCGSSINDYFQKLAYIWNTYPADSNQVKAWLDPNNFQFTLWNGFDPYKAAKKTCDTLTNIQDGEYLTLYVYKSQDGGYWSGHNQDRFTQYAEKFDNPDLFNMTGIYIKPAIVKYDSPADKVTIKVWSSIQQNGQVIVSKDVPLSFFQDSVWNFIDFDTLVTIEGNFYAGYEIYYDTPTGALTDQFAVFQVENRNNSYGFNTAYYYKNGAWASYSDTPDIHLYTSLAVNPVLCGEIPEVAVHNLPDGRSSHPLEVWPNPARDKITITLPDRMPAGGTLYIHDLTGKVLFEQNISTGTTEKILSVSFLSNGFYVVTVETKDDIFLYKLIISR